MADQIEALREKIKRLEFRAARIGDEYLKRVCRSDIASLRRQLAELTKAPMESRDS